MFINIKDFSTLSVGNMKGQISLPVRPLFDTKEVTRVVGVDKQFVAGLADYGNGDQDLLTIWLPLGLVPGKRSVLYGTGLMRFSEASFPQVYGLTGAVSITFSGSDHLVGTFDLLGVGFTVKGEFDVKGIDSPVRQYVGSEG
ncbi:hypothetical protein [Pseudomonas sp. LB3P25]